MKDGIYFVKFASSNDSGDGIVVVNNGVVNGGDYGFTYKGKIVNDEVTLSASQHDKSVVSVFGNITEYQIDLKAIESNDGYDLTGTSSLAPGVTIKAKAKFIGNLLT
ncbi:GrlR family regulatory protein [Acinetobacter ursingii]|uniref:GrlR family regulatory protein n=1 Tax=Acinetobacter ursingii TaxID=108980 RepID=UPI001D1805EA|nr:GrlR family regulatory protein [Acinetobacter ursingii]